MFCENCGSNIPDGATYCSQCGLPATMNYGVENNVKTPISPIVWIASSVLGCVITLAVVLVILFASGVLGGKDDVEQVSVTSKNNGSVPEQVTEEPTEEPAATPFVTKSPITNPPMQNDYGSQRSGEQKAGTDDDQFIDDEFLNVSMGNLLSVTASSSLAERGMIHSAERICDGSLKKAWTEGQSGQGIGESVTFTFDGEYLFSGMKINAGYQKSKSLYYKNSRPKKITLYFSDGSNIHVSLRDAFACQRVSFNDMVIASEVTLVIDSVYKGSKYRDTVISEMSWY